MFTAARQFVVFKCGCIPSDVLAVVADGGTASWRQIFENRELPVLLVCLARFGGVLIHKDVPGMTLDSLIRLTQVEPRVLIGSPCRVVDCTALCTLFSVKGCGVRTVARVPSEAIPLR